jgi:hypothetical protein
MWQFEYGPGSTGTTITGFDPHKDSFTFSTQITTPFVASWLRSGARTLPMTACAPCATALSPFEDRYADVSTFRTHFWRNSTKLFSIF